LDILFPTSKNARWFGRYDPDPAYSAAVCSSKPPWTASRSRQLTSHRPRDRDLPWPANRSAGPFCHPDSARGDAAAMAASHGVLRRQPIALAWPRKSVFISPRPPCQWRSGTLWGRVREARLAPVFGNGRGRIVPPCRLPPTFRMSPRPPRPRDILVDRLAGRSERTSKMQREGLPLPTFGGLA